MKAGIALIIVVIAGILFVQLSCSKTGTSLPPAPPDPCSFISVGVSGSVTNPSATGASDGSITVAATGGSGFTFNINGGAFKSSNIFNGLAAGNYTVVAKNAEGCSGTVTFSLANPASQCNGVNIIVTASATSNEPCTTNSAVITITTSGGVAPYTYSLDGGPFQASASFGPVASGGHIITVKDANGCTGSASTTVNNNPIGVLFAQVKSVVHYDCVGCHNASNMGGGINLDIDCNVVLNKDRIKARAVDGTPTPMPTGGLLPLSTRQKITAWINAGGRYSD